MATLLGLKKVVVMAENMTALLLFAYNCTAPSKGAVL